MFNNHQWLMTLSQQCKWKATVAQIRAQREWITCKTDSAQHTTVGLDKHFSPVSTAFTLSRTLSKARRPQPSKKTCAWVLKWHLQQVEECPPCQKNPAASDDWDFSTGGQSSSKCSTNKKRQVRGLCSWCFSQLLYCCCVSDSNLWKRVNTFIRHRQIKSLFCSGNVILFPFGF